MSGTCAPPGAANLVAAAPFELDVSLRALSSGWFSTDRVVPVTIVDIDERTHAGWSRPAITPRDAVARLITTVTTARPRAVVVDIDLSWGDPSLPADSAERQLREVLERYDGPAPLIFPKRLLDSAGGSHPAASRLDNLIGRRPTLLWGLATFATGSGGAVRTWHPWVDICAAGTAARLPAIAVLATTAAVTPVPAPDSPDCVTPPDSAEPERLLLGPRMTGPDRVPRASVQAVSASLILDAGMDRDDAALFGDRIVFIGATHPDAGDLWLTPAGIIPGVEVLASTVHYLPLAPGRGGLATAGYRVAVVLVFAGLAWITWHMVGLPMILTLILALLGGTAVMVGLFDWFRFFDVLGTALIMFVGYEAGRAVVELLWKFVGTVRRTPGRAWLRVRTALKAVALRDPEPTGGAE